MPLPCDTAGLAPGPGGWPGAHPPLPRPVPLPRDGIPYCESDYHAQFGIKCETCDRYISGRVLEVSPGLQPPVGQGQGHALGRCHPPSLGGSAAALSQPDRLPRRVGEGETPPELGCWSSGNTQSHSGAGTCPEVWDHHPRAAGAVSGSGCAPSPPLSASLCLLPWERILRCRDGALSRERKVLWG